MLSQNESLLPYDISKMARGMSVAILRVMLFHLLSLWVTILLHPRNIRVVKD